MTNLTKILDHYKTLLNLSGRQYDYKTIGAILDSSLTNARNLYEISKANYDDLQERADRLKDKLENDNL
jgi:galactokinase